MINKYILNIYGLADLANWVGPIKVGLGQSLPNISFFIF